MSRAIEDVAFERARQKAVEGWTPEHDDAHADGELAGAAAAYALYRSHCPSEIITGEDLLGYMWPFDLTWWKPTDRRRDLVKAGALILAEIDRLDRAAARASNWAGGDHGD